MQLHPCEIVYAAAGMQPKTNGTKGTCVVTGRQTYGLLFSKWVSDKFNDYNHLKPGTIISHEALFTFDEKSSLLMEKTGRDKLQRFRTYSHIITAAGEWHVLTKANKAFIYNLIATTPLQIVSLTDTGQKHLFFKHRIGFWQLDEYHIVPDVETFTKLHGIMMQLLALGFSQTEVHSGNYYPARILKAGIENWQLLENQLKPLRGQPIFDFTAWLMFTDKAEVDTQPDD